MPLPRLTPSASAESARTDSVVLVVHAPFGTDDTLSTYPDGQSSELVQHPLYQALVDVAAQGVHVVALVDRVGCDTMLVEIEGGKPASARTSTRWKQDMSSPHTLAGLLRHAHTTRPTAAVVLALEGHGAGYLPEIDRRQLTQRNLTQMAGLPVEWRISPPESGAPVLPMGAPILPMGAPILPMGAPILPANHMPLSTWGLGHALKLAQDAGVPKVAVIHFNNCFNMAVEVMHTVAPYADFATGYANYNFFTAGQSYPAVFERLRSQGPVSAGVLALWFADGNHQVLAAKGNHPTVGSVVPLARMKEIAERVDDLADALLAALNTAAPGAARQGLVQRLRVAIRRAQQFDTGGGDFVLETPDQLTDLRSLAATLQSAELAFDTQTVVPAAQALQRALSGLRVYGDKARPWLVPAGSGIEWDFSSLDLAMNILLPDPDLRGLWDWRSPFYLAVDAESQRPQVQPHVIDFLKLTDWVDFIKAYHQEVRFAGLLPAAIPAFPVFNASYDPKAPTGDGKPPCQPPYRQIVAK